MCEILMLICTPLISWMVVTVRILWILVNKNYECICWCIVKRFYWAIPAKLVVLSRISSISVAYLAKKSVYVWLRMLGTCLLLVKVVEFGTNSNSKLLVWNLLPITYGVKENFLWQRFFFSWYSLLMILQKYNFVNLTIHSTKVTFHSSE